jgi:uncharacterized protein YprB with RNaseH-like and TPR domain
LKTFTRDYTFNYASTENFDLYFGGRKFCVFDIETTGLSPSMNKVILSALLVPTDKGIKVTQFLAEDPFDEDLVLASTIDFLISEQVEYLVTYNGLAFDVPFTNRRLESLHHDVTIDCFNFDLNSFLRKTSVLPSLLEKLSQKSVEAYFGIGYERRDTISGREVSRLFYKYAEDKDPVKEKLILAHNREDVIQLFKLLHIIIFESEANLLRTEDFHEAIALSGFPVFEHELSARPKLYRNKLVITGKQFGRPLNATVFPDMDVDTVAEFSAPARSYRIEVPVLKYEDSLYVDLRPFRFSRDLMYILGVRELDGFVNDYVILREGENKKHREINAFSMLLIDSIMDRFAGYDEQPVTS